jgi:hypothetical protein
VQRFATDVDDVGRALALDAAGNILLGATTDGQLGSVENANSDAVVFKLAAQ